MKTNIRAFKALKKKYESITLSQLEKFPKNMISNEVLNILTGYGDEQKCSLCKAAEKREYECERCMYSLILSTSDNRYACTDGDNGKSMDAISDAKKDRKKLLRAIKSRAKRMDKVLEKYYSMKKK